MACAQIFSLGLQGQSIQMGLQESGSAGAGAAEAEIPRNCVVSGLDRDQQPLPVDEANGCLSTADGGMHSVAKDKNTPAMPPKSKSKKNRRGGKKKNKRGGGGGGGGGNSGGGISSSGGGGGGSGGGSGSGGSREGLVQTPNPSSPLPPPAPPHTHTPNAVSALSSQKSNSKTSETAHGMTVSRPESEHLKLLKASEQAAVEEEDYEQAFAAKVAIDKLEQLEEVKLCIANVRTQHEDQKTNAFFNTLLCRNFPRLRLPKEMLFQVVITGLAWVLGGGRGLIGYI